MKRTMFPLIALVALLGLIGCASDPAVAPATVDAADSQRPAEDLPEPLPVDPAVTVGRLGNGLTYYIRENDEPEDRAFLRLAVNAGSILEDERQLGLAHFLEHMAFNGTETYSGNEIIAFLETLGMAFGPDVNAYTGFDQTVYELTLPTDDPERFSTGLNVLVEWAHWMTLSDEEIEKERGVIIEEWRFRRSASSRMHEEQYPVLFWNSRYAERLPIGDIELIAEFPPEDLRRFYRDWYRPELMAVVAVGDFQAAEVEALINEYFGAIPATPEPVERPTFEVPGHPDTKYVVASDPEAPYTDVSFIVKRDREELATEVDYRNMLVGDLFSAMLNARLEEISLQEEAPFLAAGVSLGPLVRTESAAGLSAVVEGNAVGPALEALVVEARRVVEHGFTETELARARANRLRAMEQLYRERENLNSASFADEYVRAYLEGEAIPGIPVELELTERLLPTIPLAEVNAVADEYLKESNRVVMVSAVERDDLPEVTEAQLRQAVIVAESAPVQPYQDREVAQTLLDGLPPAGAVVAERQRVISTADGPIGMQTEVTEWELSNGARVLLLPTEHRADQVLFSSYSPGGSSVVPEEQFRSAQYATVFTERMGYGALSATDLERYLAGSTASAAPYIDTNYEGISGSASVEDLELMMQLVHLKLTQPRRDQAVYDALMRQLQTVVANQENQPRYLFSRRLQELFSSGHPRTMPVDAGAVETIRLEDLLTIYQDRFADFSESTFVFVGNVEPTSFRALVEQYLASLPSTGRGERWRDLGIERPDGVEVATVRAGIDPVSEVALVFHGEYEFSQEANYALRAVERLLDIRMQEVIREDESGTYGVGVQAQFSRIPTSRYSLLITFRADPARVAELTRVAFQVVEEARTTPAEPEYVQRITETQRAGFVENLTSNQFWLGQIEYAEQNERPLSAIPRYLTLVKELSPEAIRSAAVRYLDPGRYVQVTLYPAEWEGDGQQ